MSAKLEFCKGISDTITAALGTVGSVVEVERTEEAVGGSEVEGDVGLVNISGSSGVE